MSEKIKLLETFNPTRQMALISNSNQAFTAKAPTLAGVRTKMGNNVIAAWLEAQLLDLAIFAGVKEKMSDHQMEGLSALILADCFYLKLTELMYFFARLKLGKYGRFYGAVDPMVIGEALEVFKRERMIEMNRISKLEQEAKAKAQEKERQRQRDNGELMSYAEYKEIEWLFNM